MRTISVLCASKKSVYHEFESVEVYDENRDARTFQSDTPIIAHPPCRSWSAYCGHQAKPAEGERDLALWCCDQLRECGGVLEQPAHSRLFAAAGLPLPGGSPVDGVFSIAVYQWWWGNATKKATWLVFSGIDRSSLEIPFRLAATWKGHREMWNTQSKGKRAATNLNFAKWLIDIARKAK